MNEIPLFYNSNSVLKIQLYVVDKRETSNILMLKKSKQRTTIVMSGSFGEFGRVGAHICLALPAQ